MLIEDTFTHAYAPSITAVLGQGSAPQMELASAPATLQD